MVSGKEAAAAAENEGRKKVPFLMKINNDAKAEKEASTKNSKRKRKKNVYTHIYRKGATTTTINGSITNRIVRKYSFTFSFALA